MGSTMDFVIDTNIISESAKAKPNASVMEWLSSNASRLFITSITIEELRFGEYMMPHGKKRRALQKWIDSLLIDFSHSILGFDAEAADMCAQFHEKAVSLGRTPTIEGLMIASIAHVKGCAVVTRNIKDFDYLGIELVNPFDL